MMGILDYFLFVILGGFAVAALVQTQDDQSGFISLDCGLPRNSNYTEKTTNITYISDADFTDTGISKDISPEFRTDNLLQQFWNVRSFPDGIRNCYRLNLRRGNQYLIRATFLYGNYDGQEQLPKFDLYLGPNLWGSVALQNVSTPVAMEIIHVISSNHLQICLVDTKTGTPFISALELRVLNNRTYTTTTGSLEHFLRLDMGSMTNQTIRFDEDDYDRTWIPFNFAEWTQLNTSLAINTQNVYQPPQLAMRTAASPKNGSRSMDFSLVPNDTSSQFYVYMHFAELQELKANESREFNISYNGKHWYGPFSPSNLSTTTVFTPSALRPQNGQYDFSIHKTESSTLPPLLNAIEIYTVKEFLLLETDQKDVDAIKKIKSTYGVKRNWQGDPCAPQAYMWDGLNCSYNHSEPPRITSLNLSSSGLTGPIAPEISSLTHLQYLDLSNNNLNGTVPTSLSQLMALKEINLYGNRLTGSVPNELLERKNNGSLALSVGGNPDLCASFSCKKEKKFLVPVVASAVSLFVILIAASTTLWILRRRKQAKRVDTDSSKRNLSLALKNPCLTYSEILKITNNFERVLGKGGFGTVYYGLLDGTEVAVKMLSPSSVQGYKQFRAEVELLLRVHHRNLTGLVGFCHEDTTMGLVYEYMAKNLAEHLSESCTNILTWESRLQIITEVAQGLEYLHNGCKPHVIHRDVKATNILLNENLEAKLADFGLSRTFPVEGDIHVSTIVAGTPGYLDPEYYISNRLTEKSDVYSFGVVLLEIITSRPVVAKTNDKIHISQWVSSMLVEGDIENVVDPRLHGDFDNNSAWRAVEVAMACISLTSNDRPTMTEVVRELKECLAAEKARTQKTREVESKDFVDMTMTLSTELSPRPR